MKRWLQRRGTKGFTLLELLIVIVVLAILAGLALPQYVKTVARTKEGEGWQMMATIRGALMRYYAVNDEVFSIEADWGVDLDIQDPNDATVFPLAYFIYTLEDGADGTFTLTAAPTTTRGRKVAGVRELTLSSAGERTEN